MHYETWSVTYILGWFSVFPWVVLYILIISANPSTFRKLHFFCIVPAVSFSYRKWNDLHMGIAIPTLQNDWGKFKRQNNWYKNLKLMWSTEYQKICLCKWNSFQTLLEKCLFWYQRKTIFNNLQLLEYTGCKDTLHRGYRLQGYIAYRLGHMDLLSPHPFLDLSLQRDTAFSARVKIKGCGEELVYQHRRPLYIKWCNKKERVGLGDLWKSLPT